MPSPKAGYAGLAVLLGGALLLAGCMESHLRLSPDFGVAARQDVAAQIADPDARYAGVPGPGQDGARTALAQTRYKTDKVIQPASTITQQVVAGGQGGGGSTGP